MPQNVNEYNYGKMININVPTIQSQKCLTKYGLPFLNERKYDNFFVMLDKIYK